MGSPIVISILANANQANATLNKTLTTTQRVGNGFRKMGKPAVIALGGIVALGNKAAKAAADDARGQTILATASRRAAKATDAQIASQERFIDKTSRAVGVADDQLRPALGNLIRSTGSLEKSQKALGIALDVSAATGKDVTTVSAALAKGYSGNTGALGKLVPGISKAILKTGDMKKITAELARTTGGTAAKAANTAAGARARETVAMNEAVETIGGRLIPVYAKAAVIGAAAANWLAKNERTAYLLVGAIAALAAIVVVVNVAMKVATAVTAVYTAVTKTSALVQRAATAASLGTRIALAALAVQTIATSAASKAAAAAQWLLNAALTANPIGLVVVAIAALVGGLILAYRHSETFRNIVNAVFGFIAKYVPLVVGKVVGFVKDHWKLLLSILTGPIGAATIYIVSHWRQITGAASSMVNGVKSRVGSVVSFVKGIPGKIKNGVGDLSKTLYNAGAEVIGGLIHGIESKVSSLTGKLKSITKLIPIHKGPIGKDAKLLAPAGAAIMDGLIGGIESKEARLIHTLQRVTRHVANTSITGPDFAFGADGKGKDAFINLSGSTTQPTVNITVKFDSKMTEAEMGLGYDRAIAAAKRAGLIPK